MLLLFSVRHYLICDNDGSYNFDFDHNKKAFFIHREIFFGIKPNIDKIKKQLVDKYGSPDASGAISALPGGTNIGTTDDLCWGSSCYTHPQNNNVWTGTSVSNRDFGKYLFIDIDLYERRDTGSEDYKYNYYRLAITLSDRDAYEANEEWAKTMNKQLEEEKRVRP